RFVGAVGVGRGGCFGGVVFVPGSVPVFLRRGRPDRAHGQPGAVGVRNLGSGTGARTGAAGGVAGRGRPEPVGCDRRRRYALAGGGDLAGGERDGGAGT